MNKFNIGDKVKIKHPDTIDDFGVYYDEWIKWWPENINIIFTVFSADYDYYLKYPNGDEAMNPITNNIARFLDDELQPYIPLNSFPDDLFEL